MANIGNHTGTKRGRSKWSRIGRTSESLREPQKTLDEIMNLQIEQRNRILRSFFKKI